MMSRAVLAVMLSACGLPVVGGSPVYERDECLAGLTAQVIIPDDYYEPGPRGAMEYFELASPDMSVRVFIARERTSYVGGYTYRYAGRALAVTHGDQSECMRPPHHIGYVWTGHNFNDVVSGLTAHSYEVHFPTPDAGAFMLLDGERIELDVIASTMQTHRGVKTCEGYAHSFPWSDPQSPECPSR
jgi:hypothetical protein